jgi:protein phosphatase/serine/threonine-protein phosphatase Stp1
MSGEGIQGNTACAGRFRSTAATHAGAVRPSNQDGFVNRPDLGLWAVADGAGGHEAGEVASRLVVTVLEAIPADLPPGELLAEVQQRLETAHETLRQEAARRGPGTMIATTVVVLLAHEDHFACLWAGDSRAYLLRDGTLLQVTRDHSLVQDLVDSGVITEEAAENHPHANVVTRALGADLEAFSLDKQLGGLLAGDRLMVCSDGVTKVLAEAEIATLLGAGEEAGADRLIMAALGQQARDNVTAVAVQVDGPGGRAFSAACT